MALPAQALRTRRVSELIGEALLELGVTHAFGIIGGACGPLLDGLQRVGLKIVQSRHEAGAVFQAIEAYFATGWPAACFVTTGPGLTNCLTGICAARWDGAKVLLLSGASNPASRGRGTVQETTSYTLPQDLFYAPGPIFNFALCLSDFAEFEQVRARLSFGIGMPGGFVAHVGIPLEMQQSDVPMPRRTPGPLAVAPQAFSSEAAATAAEALDSGSFAVWVGAGALESSAEILELCERTGAHVMCSPRSKGIFPENHPSFIGVTGAGGHPQTLQYMESYAPERLLVLGTRMGEVTSFFDRRFVPRNGFIHVDIDPSAFGAAYPFAPTLGIQADCGAFLRALLPLLRRRPRGSALPSPWPPAGEFRETGPVRPQMLMRAIQTVVVDGSESIVMSESGSSFGWANHHLRFHAPGRYRTSSAWGAMGHMTAGVVGAAVATGQKVVALVGDGAMLMNNEINTAVRHGANAVWVVLNDARFGIVEQAMRMARLNPVETDLPRSDFVEFARSMGADGVRVEREVDLEAALRAALAAEGPFVVDVIIDPNELSPVVQQRVRSLGQLPLERAR